MAPQSYTLTVLVLFTLFVCFTVQSNIDLRYVFILCGCKCVAVLMLLTVNTFLVCIRLYDFFFSADGSPGGERQ